MTSSQLEINREATKWLSRLMAPNADRESLRLGFYNWLLVSERHLPAFLAAFRTAQERGPIDRFALITIRQILDGMPSNEMPGKVTPIRGRSAMQGPLEERSVFSREDTVSSSHWTKRLKWAIGFCAVLILAIGVTRTLPIWSMDLISFKTQVGERKTVTLPDGTEVTLNTGTNMLLVRFSDTERVVRLVTGEARFEVNHDVHRPFRVQTPNALLEDVGTAFDAYVRGDSMTVSVTEGQVDAWVSTARSWLPWHWNIGAPTRIGAGDVAEFSSIRRGGLEVRHPPALALKCKLSWTDGDLCFNGETVGEVAAEFNRYNARHIAVSPDLQSVRVGGTFRIDGTDSFVNSLKTTLAVSHIKVVAHPDRDGDADVIRLDAVH